MAKAQHNAYIKQMHRYDALMTGRSWWGHLFMNGLWQVDQLQMAAEVLAMIPDDFAGRLLDVPVGTAVFTCDKYKQLAKARSLRWTTPRRCSRWLPTALRWRG